jgi:phosphoserine phosphatase
MVRRRPLSERRHSPVGAWECEMTKLILTRHGHVEGIEPERFRGCTELPLPEIGDAQAKAVANRIAESWHPKGV